MRKQKSETPIVAIALEYCRFEFGGVWWRANSGGNKSGHRCNSINLPDLCGSTRMGQSAFVEVKTSEGRLTDEQFTFLWERHKAGSIARVFVQDTMCLLTDVPDRNMPRSFPKTKAKSNT